MEGSRFSSPVDFTGDENKWEVHKYLKRLDNVVHSFIWNTLCYSIILGTRDKAVNNTDKILAKTLPSTIMHTNKDKTMHAYGHIKTEAEKQLHLVKGSVKLKQVESLGEKKHKTVGNHFSIADLKTTKPS